jgi:hypothetical protein
MSQLASLLDLRFVLDLAQCIVLIVLWLRKPGQDAGDKAAAALLAAQAVASRLDVIDERLRHMPSETKLAELEGDFKAMSATLEAMQESQDTVRGTVQRIEQFLLNSRG